MKTLNFVFISSIQRIFKNHSGLRHFYLKISLFVQFSFRLSVGVADSTAKRI
ncbi:hypothetical protein PFLA_a1052 [Pseudoalteromonas flavipulchra NCIMB 2033 = ATCC BAA-314]|nr:hypothetical protein [Pseudoalteromonas flavipulchra NCIMB 2033 = ATCC BAA-314]